MVQRSKYQKSILWFIYVFSCLVFVTPLSASVHLCLVVTYLERAELLALVCGF